MLGLEPRPLPTMKNKQLLKCHIPLAGFMRIKRLRRNFVVRLPTDLALQVLSVLFYFYVHCIDAKIM